MRQILPPPATILSESHVIFNSPHQFYSTGSDLLKMTDKELDDWERKNSFQSFRSVFKKAQDEWNNVTNISDTLLILNKYQDVLTYDNGSLIPNIPVGIYQIICNRQGFYETGGVMNRVSGSYIYSIVKKEADKLFELEANTKELLVSKYYEESEKESLSAKTQGACGFSAKVSFFDNPSGCKNDRISYTEFKQSYYEYTDYFLLIDGSAFYRNYKKAAVEIYVWGSKKNWLCSWNEYYMTSFYVRNSFFTVSKFKNISYEYYNVSPLAPQITKSNSIVESVSVVLPDYSLPNEAERLVVYNELLGDYIINEAIAFNIPTRVHIEGKTRGTTGWAIVDCQ